MDLFEPGSGLQRHDNNGGILASGLFWTLPVSDRAVRVSRDRRHATLEVDDQQVIDSFQFGGAFQTPARVSFRAEWRATGPAIPQASGNAVRPEDKRAWLGEMAPALSTARIEGEEFGFAFRSDGAARTDRGGYAQLGRERNGVFL